MTVWDGAPIQGEEDDKDKLLGPGPSGIWQPGPQGWAPNTGSDRPRGGDGGPVDESTKFLQQLLEYAKTTQAQNRNMLGQQVRPSIDALGQAGQLANARNTLVGAARFGNTGELSGKIDAYGGELDKGLGNYNRDVAGLNQSDLDALGGFTGSYDQLVKKLGGLNWQDAKSAGEGLDAQRTALGKYAGLLDPQVTAQERMMAEQSRRASEQQERSSRDAVMSDLGARGMRGSGAELTNMLGSQQLTGQSRVLADMGMNANAVDRSMQALKGYGDVSGMMRQSDDVMGMFNAQQGQAAKQWQQEEEKKLADDRLSGVTGVNKGVSDRASQTLRDQDSALAQRNKADSDKYTIWDQYYGDQDKYAADQYGRQKDHTGALMDYGGLWTGTNSTGANAVMGGYGQVAGHYAAQDAARELNRPRGLLGYLGIT